MFFFTSLNGKCQEKLQEMKFEAFSYFTHFNSDTSKELKWFTCSNIGINIYHLDSTYKRIEINKKPESLKIYIKKVENNFIDKENIAWIYFNTSNEKLGDATIKLGLFNKSKKLNGINHVGYLMINSKDGVVGYALKL